MKQDMENRSGNKSSIAFTVELFMLFGIMLLVIVVITQTLVMTRSRSLQARHLTEAVIAAENTMEIISSSADDPAGGLEAAENISGVTEKADMLECETVFDGKDGSGETYLISVIADSEKGETGSIRKYEVRVSLKDEEEILYSLKSGVYERGQDR